MEDFEVALKLDSKHVNAKKYMCETLLAHAQMYVFCIKLSHFFSFHRAQLRFRCKNHSYVEFHILWNILISHVNMKTGRVVHRKRYRYLSND